MSFDVERIWSNPNWKNGALYTLFSFANNGISFILILILAKYLLPSVNMCKILFLFQKGYT